MVTLRPTNEKAQRGEPGGGRVGLPYAGFKLVAVFPACQTVSPGQGCRQSSASLSSRTPGRLAGDLVSVSWVAIFVICAGTNPGANRASPMLMLTYGGEYAIEKPFVQHLFFIAC